MSITRTEQDIFTCPECGGSVASDTGETFCVSCGLVIDDGMLNRQQKPPFMDEDGEGHTIGRGDTSNAKHDKQLGSIISYKNQDAKGKPIPKRLEPTYKRLRDEQKSRQFSSKDLRKREGMGQIHRVISAMDLPYSLTETAGRIFDHAHEKNLAVGHSIDGIAIVSAYLAARIEGHIRDLDEWLKHTHHNKKAFKTDLRHVQSNLDIGYIPSKPSDYTQKLLDDFELGAKERKQSIELVKKAEANNLHVGKQPKGVVGGAIYLSANHLTQKRVAEVIGMTKKTVRSNSQEISKL